MGRSMHFNLCLREIRQCVYGRDNRKPIADSLDGIHNTYLRDAQLLYAQEQKRTNVIEAVHDSGQMEGDYTMLISRPIDQ